MQMSDYGCVSVTVYLQEKSKISPNAWPYFQRQSSNFNWKIIWLNLFLLKVMLIVYLNTEKILWSEMKQHANNGYLWEVDLLEKAEKEL